MKLPAAAPAYRAFMRDSASKSYLRDPAPTRADLAVLALLLMVLAASLFLA
jgi:hypothetical protein